MRFPPPMQKKKFLRLHHLVYALMAIFVLNNMYRALCGSLVPRLGPSQADHNISGLVEEYRRKMEEWMEENPTQEQKDIKNEQIKAALWNSLTRNWD